MWWCTGTSSTSTRRTGWLCSATSAHAVARERVRAALPAQGLAADRPGARGPRPWSAGSTPRSASSYPDSFIPEAERTGLIEPITHWVLDEALHQCRRWMDEADRVRFARALGGGQPVHPQPAGRLASRGGPGGPGPLAGARPPARPRDHRDHHHDRPRPGPDGCSPSWPRWASPSRSTTSAPGTRHWPTSGTCRSTNSRSTGPSSRTWAVTPTTRSSSGPWWTWPATWGCERWPRGSRTAATWEQPQPAGLRQRPGLLPGPAHAGRGVPGVGPGFLGPVVDPAPGADDQNVLTRGGLTGSCPDGHPGVKLPGSAADGHGYGSLHPGGAREQDGGRSLRATRRPRRHHGDQGPPWMPRWVRSGWNSAGPCWPGPTKWARW